MKKALLVGINALEKAGILAIILLCQEGFHGRGFASSEFTTGLAYVDAGSLQLRAGDFTKDTEGSGWSPSVKSALVDVECGFDSARSSPHRVALVGGKSSISPRRKEHPDPIGCGVNAEVRSSTADCLNPRARSRGWPSAIDASTYAERSAFIVGGNGPGQSIPSLGSLARIMLRKSVGRETGIGRAGQEGSILPSSARLSREKSKGGMDTGAESAETKALPAGDWKFITQITTGRTMTSRTSLPCTSPVISRII
jgi:hypothetical protein